MYIHLFVRGRAINTLHYIKLYDIRYDKELEGVKGFGNRKSISND